MKTRNVGWVRTLLLITFVGFFADTPLNLIWADEATNREIARTQAFFYLRLKDYSMASKVLSDHLEGDQDDYDAWNLLGLTTLESGQLSQAKFAFFQASQKGKGQYRGVFLYNYADALARDGEVDKARDALKHAEREPLVASSARKALEKLEAKKPLPEISLSIPSYWQGVISAGLGYDTNVLQAPTSTVAYLKASDIASPSYSIMSSLSRIKPVGSVDWEGNGVVAFSGYTATNARIFNSLYAAAKFQRKGKPEDIGGWGWSLGDKPDVSFLNSAGMKFYNFNNQLFGRLTLRHGASAETEFEPSFYYRLYSKVSNEDPKNNRDGWTLYPILSHRRFLGSHVLSLAAQYEYAQTKGENYRAHTMAIPVSYMHPLPWGFRALEKVEAGYVLFPNHPQKRKDPSVKAGVTLLRRFGGGWTVTTDYTYRKSFSNVPTYKYSKHVVNLGVSYDL